MQHTKCFDFVWKYGVVLRNRSMNTHRTVIYARVSTDTQSVDSQLLELRSYCERRGWTNPLEITDTVSGTTRTRKGLDRLMKLVRAGKADVIVAYKLDRIGRSLSHLALLVEELATHKVGLVIPSQGIDTSVKNAVAEAQLGMLAVFAAFERSMIVERVNSGLKVAKAKGIKLGRPSRRNPHYDAVRGLRAFGYSGPRIARELAIGLPLTYKLIGQLKKEAEAEAEKAAA
jgi:putative DNA-invertase from lambdoid prophage Rac